MSKQRSYCLLSCGLAAAAHAQSKSPVGGDIVVTGRASAGSAMRDAAPVAVFDEAMIRGMGVTSAGGALSRLGELGTLASGTAPVTLLNGRRVAGPDDFQDLPPEAIEKIEVLPEGEAIRLGYPATVRVVNFITKKYFRSRSAFEYGGPTTEGGGESNFVELNGTRIDGPRRGSLTLSHLHEGAIGQDQRHIAADPASPFAVGGNLARPDGSSLAPALDALAGRPVSIASLPADAATRGNLARYVDAPPNITDLGSSRTLQDHRETLRANATLGVPLNKQIDASLNLSSQLVLADGRNGYAPVVSTLPAGSVPFTSGVLLYRYLPDVVLHQQSRALTLHAGGTVQGSIRRFGWSLISSYDRVSARAAADIGVQPDALGNDPFAVPSVSRADLVREVSRTTTQTISQVATVNGPVVRLPGGQATVTATLDLNRASSSTSGSLSLARVSRTIRGASVAAELPVVRAGQVPLIGQVSLNATYGLSDVSNYNRLRSYSYGLRWRPLPPVQLTASVTQTQTAPAVDLLGSPLLVSPNTPVFDFITGTSALVTATRGGNPALAPSSRRVTTFGASIQPWAKRELRFGIDYLATDLDRQTATLSSATPEFQAAFPQLFGRDASGRLTSIDLRPVNLAAERERRIRLSINLQTPLGRAPPAPTSPPGVQAQDQPPPAPPKPRPQLTATLTANYRLTNRLQAAPGFASLNLLDGATIDGTTGRPRWTLEAFFTGSYQAYTFGVLGRLQGPSTIRSPIPSADLHFSERFWFSPFGTIDLEKIIQRPWARRLTFNFAAENVLNNRIKVRDQAGATPYRFQGALIDPLGRAVRVGLRKSF